MFYPENTNDSVAQQQGNIAQQISDFEADKNLHGKPINILSVDSTVDYGFVVRTVLYYKYKQV